MPVSRRDRSRRLIGPFVLIPLLAAAAAGCSTTRSTETTASIAPPGGAMSESEWRHELQAAGDLYRASPRDGEGATRYARALRAIGQRAPAAGRRGPAAHHEPE